MSKALNLIGPTLRGLLAEGTRLPLIRCEMQGPGVTTKSAFSDEMEPERLKDLLHEAVVNSNDTSGIITLDGVGTFSVKPIGPSPGGRAAGKIAVVTGAAQGIGLEIAQDLVAQGAYVALADLNETGVKSAAAELKSQYGEDRALATAIDVTNGCSISTALSVVVQHYGGIDLFVSNAGVLKAGSVKTQPEEDFDFVTSVNYKGYFLSVQKVAPIMAMQHLACPAYRSDIIQINSKSGLEGSNRNGAYAGSKFGGVGLTQSFALELVEDGIKVNAICPGNFFDGPLWSDPDNGLFVQYLRSNKVPGARTVDDVRAYYEARVPMRRGCAGPDVMKAVYYLMEQQYETGQALAVTGGQVMLH